jgi:hypothetical protein
LEIPWPNSAWPPKGCFLRLAEPADFLHKPIQFKGL